MLNALRITLLIGTGACVGGVLMGGIQVARIQHAARAVMTASLA